MVEVPDLVVLVALLRRHCVEAPAVRDDVRGAVLPALLQHGVEHRERAAGALDEERVVVQLGLWSGHGDVGGTHGPVTVDRRRAWLLPAGSVEAADDRIQVPSMPSSMIPTTTPSPV